MTASFLRGFAGWLIHRIKMNLAPSGLKAAVVFPVINTELVANKQM